MEDDLAELVNRLYALASQIVSDWEVGTRAPVGSRAWVDAKHTQAVIQLRASLLAAEVIRRVQGQGWIVDTAALEALASQRGPVDDHELRRCIGVIRRWIQPDLRTIILAMRRQGLRSKAIAAKLGISESRVRQLWNTPDESSFLD